MGLLNKRRSSKAIVEVALLAVFRVLAIAIGLVYVKIYTNLLLPSALGIFFYLSTLSAFLNAAIFTPFDYYLQTFCTRVGGRLPVWKIARLSGTVLATGLGVVVLLGSLLVMLRQLLWTDLISLYAVAVLLFGCLSLRNLLNNRGYRHIVASALVFEAIAKVAAIVVLTRAIEPSGRALFSSMAAALFLELIVLSAFAAKRLPWTREEIPVAGSPLIVAIAPISISAGCNLVQMQGYRTIYPWIGSPSPAALFAVVCNVGASGMSAAGQVFSQILLPRVYSSGGAYIRRYITYATMLTAAIAIVAWLAAPWLVVLITSARYVQYANLAVFGVLVEGANLIMVAITVRLMLRDETYKLMIFNIAAAIVGAGGFLLAAIFASGNPYAIGWMLLLSQAVVLGGLATTLQKGRDEQHD